MFSMQSGGGKRGPSRDGFDIYVGNLPEKTTEDQMRSYFQRYGEVVSITLKENFGFVRFATEEQYIQALGSNVSDFHGSKIIIKKGNKKSKQRNKDGGNDGAQNFSGNKPDLVSNHQALPLGSANKPPFKIERKEQLVVSHVESPVTFWAQNIANSEIIADITMKLQSLCSSVFPSTPRPATEKVYAAKFSEDENWYRCKVVNFHSPNQVEVLYIDYGNWEVKNDTELVELPPGLQQPHPQASRYTLYGLNPCHPDQTTAGFEQGRTYFKSLVEQKVIEADVISSDQLPICIPVILYGDGQDINQMMLDKGHAEMRATVKGQGGNAPGSYGGRLPGMDGQQNRHSQPKSKFTSAGRSHQPHRPKLMEVGGVNWENPPSQGAHGPPMWLATKGAGDNLDLESLKSEVARTKGRLSEASAQAEKQRIKYQQEIDRLMRENAQIMEERNSCSLQLATTKGKLKSAESLVSQLTTDALKNDFSLKLRTLLRDISRVRTLRGQFPTDDSRDDQIENGLMLLLQEDTLKGSNIMSFVEDVETSCGSFNVIQSRIRCAKSVEEVDDILEARNDARCELQKKIEDFLEAVEKFPVANASADFQIMIHCLEDTYEPLMRGPFDQSCMLTLEEIESKWTKWKAENTSAIQEVRTDVNTYHNKVDSLLTQLQEQLRLKSDDSTDVNNSCLHLPQCITDLQGAIDKEITITDLEDKNETCLEIRAIVRSLAQSCSARLEQLGILKAYKAQYEALQQKLAPWLKNKPDLQEVQSMRKNIRACNSKLRHRLADKLDLEEADDTAPEEMQKVKESITELRNELQAALAKQDELVSNIQEVILNQFPELALEYADLGIKTCAEYSGLVKEGRSLDHFDLEALDENRKGLYKSTFCGQPVILKEYLLDDSVGVSKTEFLKRVQSYHNAQNEYLLPLQAVFFTKNERQAIIQVPRYEGTLVKKVEDGDLEFELVQSLLKNVVEGVAALHKRGIIHGSVNAQNIFLTDDNKAVLSCVDFLKSAEQRALSGNPQFTAPEILAGGQATFKSDVYSLGVLTYWLNFPQAAPTEEWPPEAKDTPLQQLVVQSTEKSPSDRPNAAELLTYPFFKSRIVVSRDTLQLRVKTNCQKSEGGGILKYSSPTKDHPPPDVIKIGIPVKNVDEDSSEKSAQAVVDGSAVEITNIETDPVSDDDEDDDDEEDDEEDDDEDDDELNSKTTLNDTETDSTQDDLPVSPENGIHSEDDEKKKRYSNKMSSHVMIQHEGTPTLPCTPMDTPSNTPIESENNTPAKPHGDLHSSMVQASLETLLTNKTAEGVELEENEAGDNSCLHDSDDGDSMPALEEGQ